jgi:hypothetical protein
MNLSTLAALLATHAKVATVAAATAAVTAGGGLAVATAVTADNPHAQAGLAKAAAAQAAHQDAADEAASDEASTTDAADVTLPECPADVKNHGAYVSSVAKSKPAEGDAPNAHGKLVSAAAQSDCGKPATSSDDSEAGDDESDDAAAGHAKGHTKTHPSGRPDTAGKSGTHSKAGAHRQDGAHGNTGP